MKRGTKKNRETTRKHANRDYMKPSRANVFNVTKRNSSRRRDGANGENTYKDGWKRRKRNWNNFPQNDSKNYKRGAKHMVQRNDYANTVSRGNRTNEMPISMWKKKIVHRTLRNMHFDQRSNEHITGVETTNIHDVLGLNNDNEEATFNIMKTLYSIHQANNKTDTANVIWT